MKLVSLLVLLDFFKALESEYESPPLMFQIAGPVLSVYNNRVPQQTNKVRFSWRLSVFTEFQTPTKL
jgi:hypothetical protein